LEKSEGKDSVGLPTKETRDKIHAVLNTSDEDLIAAGVLAIDPVTLDEYSPALDHSRRLPDNAAIEEAKAVHDMVSVQAAKARIQVALEERDFPPGVLQPIYQILEIFPLKKKR